MSARKPQSESTNGPVRIPVPVDRSGWETLMSLARSVCTDLGGVVTEVDVLSPTDLTLTVRIPANTGTCSGAGQTAALSSHEERSSDSGARDERTEPGHGRRAGEMA